MPFRHTGPIRTLTTFLSKVFVSLILLGLSELPASAQGPDPHQIYERKCAGCHEAHAGDFVHDNVTTGDGKVIGRRSGRPVAAFLARGHGKLAPPERAVLIEHLEQIARSGALFHDKCLVCHDRAVVFARSRLIGRQGKLVGRYSGRDVRAFLSNHGRVTAEEADTLTAILAYQLRGSQF
ncbi:hypothetical protein [Roseibium sp.]|uniref:hypothetical protein n=1 Tax=Roseibium sp. TaxID=1936156 RepID=UPI003A984FBF